MAPGDAEDVVWQQFTAQFEDYDRAATVNRLAYQSFRVLTLGGVIVVSEGLQQMFQWHANWIAYRSVAEQMRYQAFAFRARTPPFDRADRRQRLAAFGQQVALSKSTTWAHRMQGVGEAAED